MNRLTAPKAARTQSDAATKAAAIYEYTHISASSLVAAFRDTKAKRGNPRGILTDQEQDLLRAALVMSCAGLDALMKQSIRDGLSILLEKDDSVRAGFEKSTRKRITGDADSLEFTTGAKFLSTILIDTNPRDRLIEEYIRELTGDSLQSAEEVLRTVAALGIDSKQLGLNIRKLREIFKIRNKIIHELDIELDRAGRKRVVRGQDDLIGYSSEILKTGKAYLEALDAKLR